MTHDRKHLREAREDLFKDIGVPEPKPFVPDEYQLEAIQYLRDGFDTLVIAPTGAGKTYIAVEAIASIVSRGQRAVYTAPLKALSNAKYAEFKRRFEPRYKVGLLTGDRKIETDAGIVVATTEIYRNELYSLRASYGLVVLDEFHYLADPQRGAVWEESIILSPHSSALLMLSASISNAEDIASWIGEVRNKPVKIIQVLERPVELRLAFLHPELGVIPLVDKQRNLFPEVAEYYAGGGGGGTRFRPRMGGGPGTGRFGGSGGGGKRGSDRGGRKKSGRGRG